MSEIIASAVVIPEASERPPSPQGPAKRRQSSATDQNFKRPRLSIDGSTERIDSRLPSSTATDRQRDRRKGGEKEEERKRGQRLFGALLGTLSQRSSTTAQKRRADIEKKQQNKLKLQAEEDNEQKKQALDKLMVVRRQEQRKFDEQSMRIRHSNMLAMANYLKTEAEPPLYYRPWELRPSEDARIKSQIEDAEAKVDEELDEFERHRQIDQPNDQSATNGASHNADTNEADGGAVAESKPPETVGSEVPAANLKDAVTDTNPVPETSQDDLENVESKELPDDTGEVIVEGEEDTVIF